MCIYDFYSLDWSSEKCFECMDNARCEGSHEIVVDEGFWRQSLNSSKIYECQKKSACLGGYYENMTNPVMCDEGYEGILCASCALKDGV